MRNLEMSSKAKTSHKNSLMPTLVSEDDGGEAGAIKHISGSVPPVWSMKRDTEDP